MGEDGETATRTPFVDCLPHGLLVAEAVTGPAGSRTVLGGIASIGQVIVGTGEGLW